MYQLVTGIDKRNCPVLPVKPDDRQISTLIFPPLSDGHVEWYR
jgi:hypothetical protein